MKKWFFLGFLCLCVLFFYKPLLVVGCKFALHRIGGTVSYEKVRWENGSIVISGLQRKDLNSEVAIDRIELKLAGSPLHFCPKITLSHPQILISSTGEQHTLSVPFLYRTRFMEPSWEIKNGVLQLPTGGRFYFSMLPGEEKETIGHFVFSSDPDPMIPPMFSATLSLVERNLQIGFQLQESDLSRLLPLSALVFPEIPRKWDQAGGEIQLEGLLYLDPALQFQQLHCRGEGKEIVLSAPEMGIDLTCEEIQGAFSYPPAETGTTLLLKNGSYVLNQDFAIGNVNGSLSLETMTFNGNLLHHAKTIPFECVGNGASPLIIEARAGSFEAEIAFLGPHDAAARIQGDGREILALFSDQNLEPLPIDLNITAKRDALGLLLETNGTVSGEQIKGSTLFLISNASVLPHFSLKESKWQAVSLTERSYGPFLPLLLPEIGLTGIVQGEAVLLPSGIHLEAGGYEICLEHSFAELYLPQVKEKSIQFSYDAAQKQWQGEIPLEGGQLHYRENDLSFEKLEGVMKIRDDRITASSFSAECEGLALQGNMDLLLGSGQLFLSTSSITGEVQHLLSVLRHFPSLPKLDFPMAGNFSSADTGFVLNTSSENTEWSFKASFNALSLPVNNETSITQGRCDLFFDSKKQSLNLERAEGTWHLLDGTPLTVQVKRFSTQLSATPALDFAFKIIDGKKEFAYFEGKSTRTDAAQWKIDFDPQKTYFGGTHLNISQCNLDEKMNLASFEMRPILKCQDLPPQVAFLQNAGFLPKNFSAKNLQEWQFEGTLNTRLFSESADKGFSLHAESRDLKVRGKPWNSFQLKAHKIGDNWLIEHLEGGGMTLKGAFVVDGDEISFKQFIGKWQNMQWQGSGKVKTDKKKFSCNFESVKGRFPELKSLNGNFIASGFASGDFNEGVQCVGEANLYFELQTPLALSAKNRKTIEFAYDNSRGLVCNRIDLQFKDKLSGSYVAELKAEKFLWPQAGKLSLEKMEFSLSPKLKQLLIPASLKDLSWEGNLEGSGEFQLASGPVFQAALKPGRYGFKGKDLPFEQLQLRYENNLLTFKAKTQIQEKPLWSMLQVDLSKEPFGALSLYDHPKSEGLKILFSSSSGNLMYESAQGKCYGIDCELTKNKSRKIPLANVLTGSIKLDYEALSPLLPKEIKDGLTPLKIGKGYGWQGDLILWQEPKRGFQASGALSGSEFEFLGYQFRRLQGNLEATLDRVMITDLKLEDSAGMIGIKKCELNKTEKWRLYIPQVFVRHWQPSLMQKVGGEPQAVKPFTIKNFSLSEIRCALDDKSSLEGMGKMTFVNQFKKETSFLDIPLEMIKKVGLDPNLLTPVKGELELELRGDKLYLMTLHHSFSEGERAEFYLAPTRELSYIDLDGKIHIDLKMHQDVMLKITEPFTLTIRGTLEKPRYGLQY